MRVLLLCCALTLAACGQTGDLVLPDKAEPVPAEAPPAAPASIVPTAPTTAPATAPAEPSGTKDDEQKPSTTNPPPPTP